MVDIKKLEQARALIKKKHGSEIFMDQKTLDTFTKPENVLSTGIFSLDLALDIGGIPRGRVTEIYGSESSGKSTIAMKTCVSCQKNGGFVLYIDSENGFNLDYARDIGVDLSPEKIEIIRPEYGEQALQVAETYIKSGIVELVVIDSVAALVPKAELDGDIGDAHMGLQARLLSQALRKMVGELSKSRCAAIFINQLRSKIGIVFGNPEKPTGGNALGFYSSIRLETKSKAYIKGDDSEKIGQEFSVDVKKSKVGFPGKKCSFNLLYGEGIKDSDMITEIAVDKGIINKSGSWYSYQDQKIGQGLESAKKYMEDNPVILEEIKNEILKIYHIHAMIAEKKEKIDEV